MPTDMSGLSRHGREQGRARPEGAAPRGEPFPGYNKLPESWRRQIDDGLGTVMIHDDGDGPITGFAQGPSWDVIEAMTPEQRDYYGLTGFYDFVMNLPEDQRPIPLSSGHE